MEFKCPHKLEVISFRFEEITDIIFLVFPAHFCEKHDIGILFFNIPTVALNFCVFPENLRIFGEEKPHG
jgi:hypothetical protein